MKYHVLLVFSLFAFTLSAQMNNVKLEKLLAQQTDSLLGTPGRWQATIDGRPMMIVTDETNDRMRIIMPIIEVEKLDKDVLLDCLVANFHSALDVKYAVSQDVLWSVFIHPLGSLTEEELKSAVDQVYYAAVNFGTSYASTPLQFGGANSEDKPPNVNKG